MKLASSARALLGAAELARPSLLVAQHQPDALTLRVIRVLGARDLAQAWLTVSVPTRRVVRAGVVVDLLHAASMLALAAADQRRRRTALTSAAWAGALAATGAVALWRGHVGRDHAGSS